MATDTQKPVNVVEDGIKNPTKIVGANEHGELRRKNHASENEWQKFVPKKKEVKAEAVAGLVTTPVLPAVTK